jgi:BirA family biotin operon repressor/biotin-[acetyl-CoA-carboxylase] ligase
VAEAIETVTGLPPRIKWPNDVMVRDRKVCGILTEAVAGGPGGGLAIVGIGLNVNLDPSAAGLPSTATSLSLEFGAPLRREPLLRAILSRVAARLALEDATLVAQVYRRWEALLWRRHQQVRVDQDGTTVHGVVEGLAASGALRLRRQDGTVLELAVGEIVW